MTAPTSWNRRVVLLGLSALTSGVFVVGKPDISRRAHAGNRWEPIEEPKHKDLKKRQRLVRRVQQLLHEKGYRPGPVDGLWGPKTAAALTEFQLDNQLHPDGVLGPNTLNRLFDER